MFSPVFFWSWPVWARLSFVLGGLLVMVLCLAGLVKVLKLVKIRRLMETQARDVERVQIREQLRSSDEIPFGARAMLEDPDIEGVWNSRASTPLQSPILGPRRSSPSRQSLNLFSQSRRSSSVSSLSNHHSPDVAQNLYHQSNGIGPPQPNPAEIAIIPGVVHSLSKQASQETTERCYTSLACSHTKHVPRRRSVTISATSSNASSHNQTKDSENHTRSAGGTRRQRSRVATDPISDIRTHAHRSGTLIIIGSASGSPSLESTSTTRNALDRMEAHRNFHAAESGQLQQRARIHDTRFSRHKHSVSEDLVTGQEINRAVSWPITAGEVLVDFSAPRKAEKKTSPQVVPFRAFVETHPPPKPTPKAPPSAWTTKTQGLMDEKLQPQQPRKRITIKNTSTYDRTNGVCLVANTQQPVPTREQTSLLGTQLRSVNNGFEVLPAGALTKKTAVKDFGYSKGPLRETSNDVTRPRKLQKRSRSLSRDSQISADSACGIKA